MNLRHAAAIALVVASACAEAPQENHPPAILSDPDFLRLVLHCYGDQVVKDCYSPPNIQPAVHCVRQANQTFIGDVRSRDQIVYAQCPDVIYVMSVGCEEIRPRPIPN
jgi:hypothetical protein